MDGWMGGDRDSDGEIPVEIGNVVSASMCPVQCPTAPSGWSGARTTTGIPCAQWRP